jgi:hypothetical protein
MVREKLDEGGGVILERLGLGRAHRGLDNVQIKQGLLHDPNRIFPIDPQ